jgi:hypothetical protein
MSTTPFQTQHEIAMRWQPVVEAAGMFDAAQKPANIYRLASVILDDEVVAKRRLAKIVANPDAEDVTVAVLQEMSATEKAALKERIIAAHSKR